MAVALREHARRPEAAAHLAQDPVCGMSVDPDPAEHRSYQKGETYYFCSSGCKETFDSDPGKYIGRPSNQTV